MKFDTVYWRKKNTQKYIRDVIEHVLIIHWKVQWAREQKWSENCFRDFCRVKHRVWNQQRIFSLFVAFADAAEVLTLQFDTSCYIFCTCMSVRVYRPLSGISRASGGYNRETQEFSHALDTKYGREPTETNLSRLIVVNAGFSRMMEKTQVVC